MTGSLPRAGAALALVLTLFCILSAAAVAGSTERPRIAIIIDDLGNQKKAGMRAIALPGPVACSIMPHTAYDELLANAAYTAGKEVMLHLPMQAVEMDRPAGPGEILLDSDRAALAQTLRADLAAVPHAVGVNNHMGSLITQHPGHMQWLMDELRLQGPLFFVDSYTSVNSVAFDLALESGIPTARRDVFLDGELSAQAIAAEFEKLKREARARGYAIAIGHPFSQTLAFLEQQLPLLDAQGFELVPVSDIIAFTALPNPVALAQPDAQ